MTDPWMRPQSERPPQSNRMLAFAILGAVLLAGTSANVVLRTDAVFEDTELRVDAERSPRRTACRLDNCARTNRAKITRRSERG